MSPKILHWYVEIRKEPITTAQVLKKNPRHSVTWLDVFEYPWIVVRPESVLNIKRVIYIVPNLTIYKLIKAKGYRSSRLHRENGSTRETEQFDELIEQSRSGEEEKVGVP
ncbi:hypothetical protein PTKIN_Ptkin12aG0100000 [Pterospermum kingtungense]